MELSVQILRDKKEIMIAGIPTQWVAERIIRDINDMLQRKDSSLAYFFEGGPGAYGGGLMIRIVLSKVLGDHEINALTRYFELRKARVDVY